MGSAIKGMLRYAVELCQATFGKTPERFNTINMPFATGKFITAMMNPEGFIMANIDQSVIAAPSIRMNHSIWRHMSTDNGLQCRLGTVWHNPRMNPFLGVSRHQRQLFCHRHPDFFPLGYVARQSKTHRPLQNLAETIQFAALGNPLSYFKVKAF